MGKRIAAFIRHADYQQLPNTPSAFQPFPLNETGIKQAHQQVAALVQLLTENDWSLVPELDASCLLRAWQTADIFAKGLTMASIKPKISAFEQLCERSVGSVANLSVEQIETLLEIDPRYQSPPANWKSDSHYKLPFPGAESLIEAGKRVADHIVLRMNTLPTANKTQVKLFFGHGASLRHAAYHLGILTLEQVKQHSMHHAHAVLFEYQDNGRWLQVGGDWKLRAKTSSYTD